MFAWEWPSKDIVGTALYKSIMARLVMLLIAGLAAMMLYQATNSAIYYGIALVVYLWGYCEGEV